MNALMTHGIEVTEIGGGKVLVLGKVFLLLLLLARDTLDNLLGVLVNSRVVGIGAFNHVDPVFKERPWMRSSAAIAIKWAFRRTARLAGAIIVAVLGDGLLSLTGVDLD
jgi:hypothetical protein